MEPRLGREADAEQRDRLLIEPASFQIFAGMRCLRLAQLLFEERARTFVHVEKLAAQSGLRCFLGSGVLLFGKVDANLLRNRAHGFGKRDALDLLDELEDVARFAASEA